MRTTFHTATGCPAIRAGRIGPPPDGVSGGLRHAGGAAREHVDPADGAVRLHDDAQDDVAAGVQPPRRLRVAGIDARHEDGKLGSLRKRGERRRAGASERSPRKRGSGDPGGQEPRRRGRTPEFARRPRRRHPGRARRAAAPRAPLRARWAPAAIAGTADGRSRTDRAGTNASVFPARRTPKKS